MKSFVCFTTAIILMAASAGATSVKNCPNTKARLLEPGDVTISNCGEKQCILKRKTDVSIEMKIIPKRDFNELNSDIQGIILGVPLPFIGYDGSSACPNIYDSEGKNQVGCPLKAGETYIYKNTFKILPVYPTVSLDIHWGLRDAKGYAACFQVPAKIKDKSRH